MSRYTVEFKGYLLKQDLKRCGIHLSSVSEDMGYGKNYVGTSIQNNRIDKNVLLELCKRMGIDHHKYMFKTNMGEAQAVFERMTYADKIKAMPTDKLIKAMRDIALELYDREEI